MTCSGSSAEMASGTSGLVDGAPEHSVRSVIWRLLLATAGWLLCVVLVLATALHAKDESWLWVLLVPISISIAGVFTLPRFAVRAVFDARGSAQASRPAVSRRETLLAVVGSVWLFLLGWVMVLVTAVAQYEVLTIGWTDVLFLIGSWFASAVFLGSMAGFLAFKRAASTASVVQGRAA